MTNLTLFHHSTSVTSAKVRLALHEKQLAWSPQFVDILAGEQFDPSYRRVNPRALVPTLVDGDDFIIESTVINEYLDDRFPQYPLRPVDSLGLSRMRLWTKFVDEKLHDACTVVTYVAQHRHRLLQMSPPVLEALLANTADAEFRERKRRWVVDGIAAPDLEQALRTFARCLADMELALAKGPWLAGETYSLADIALTPYVNRLAMLMFDGMWVSLPQVDGWFGRVRARPSFDRAVIEHIPAELAAEMAQRGRTTWREVQTLLRRIQAG